MKGICSILHIHYRKITYHEVDNFDFYTYHPIRYLRNECQFYLDFKKNINKRKGKKNNKYLRAFDSISCSILSFEHCLYRGIYISKHLERLKSLCSDSKVYLRMLLSYHPNVLYKWNLFKGIYNEIIYSKYEPDIISIHEKQILQIIFSHSNPKFIRDHHETIQKEIIGSCENHL